MARGNRIAVAALCGVLALLLLYAGGMAILFVSLRDTGLPRLSIETSGKQPIQSKTEYLPCSAALTGAGEHDLSPLPAEVRGRGNDTWNYYPKKPYRLRFFEDTSLLGAPAARNWVLLAMYNDTTLAKDRLAFALSNSCGSGYVPTAHYVDLYVNGSYCGVYLLTEQVDETEGRLDIEAEISKNDVEIPFFVELDARAPEEGEEGVDWFEVSGKYYAVKYPDDKERKNDSQFAYIRHYITTVDRLCRTKDVSLAALAEWIDVESFLDYYIVEELMGQPEINWKSVYMSRTADGKLRMGPVWDFDWAAMGPAFGKQRNQWKDATSGFRSVDHWFALLYENSPEFREALRVRWNEKKDALRSAIDLVGGEKDALSRAATRNHIRWYAWSPLPFFPKEHDALIAWCHGRWQWMDRELSP